MPPVVIVVAIALLFFLVIPGIGAVGVRRRWQLFRERVRLASQAAPVTYAALHARVGIAATKRVCAVGRLESIQGKSTLWVRGDSSSIAVDMTKSAVYIVSQRSEVAPNEPPLRTTWSRIGSLPEGAQVLVSGSLDTSEPHPMIRAAENDRVLAVFFDGPVETLTRACIWSGRQMNEYWNSVTPSSLAAGALALLVVSYVLLQGPPLRGVAQLAITLSALPVLPLLPPGVVPFYVYRVFWRRARSLRAFRDVLRLPLRFVQEAGQCVDLPNGGVYCCEEIDQAHFARLKNAGHHAIEPPLKQVDHAYYLFAKRAEIPDGPVDPLVENYVTIGKPALQAERCQSRARTYEFFALGVFLLGLLVNSILALILLGLLL